MAKSLTEQYRPELDRLVRTIVRLGWVFPQWRGPEFKVRRTSRHSSVTGKGCWLAIHLQVGRGADDADVFETIAHELVHAIVPPILEEYEDHGPTFRTKLRQLVRAHWPGIEPWTEDDRPGRNFAYREDDRIAGRIREFLARVEPSDDHAREVHPPPHPHGPVARHEGAGSPGLPR